MRCVIWNCIPCLGLDFEEEGRGSEIRVSVISTFSQVCICSHTILFSKSKPPHPQKYALCRLNHFDSMTAIYMWLYASNQITADACRTHEDLKTKTLPMSGNHKGFKGNKCSSCYFLQLTEKQDKEESELLKSSTSLKPGVSQITT